MATDDEIVHTLVQQQKRMMQAIETFLDAFDAYVAYNAKHEDSYSMEYEDIVEDQRLFKVMLEAREAARKEMAHG